MHVSDTRNAIDTGRSARRSLLLMALLFLGSLGVALLLFYGLQWRPTATSNHGELIQPAQPLAPFTLQALDGGPYDLDDLRGKWTFVYLDSAGCGEGCRAALYKMRQVRLTQGREMHRVQGLFILTDPADPEGLRETLREHEGLTVVHGTDVQAVAQQFTGPHGGQVEPGRVYIVDPLGNLMMTYPPDFDPQGLKKDITTLLKLSHIG